MLMAEVKVEATFLGSLKAINEEAEILEDTNGASGQQIESSSSDEYDPAQDVQDVLLTAGSQGSSNQVLHVDASEYNRVHSASSSEESSYTPTNGVATLAPELNHSALDQLETRLELTDNAAASTEVADSTAPSASKPDSTVITPNPDIGAPVLDGISNASVLQTDKSPILAVTNSTLPKARLPHDKVGMLEDRIKDDERGDMDAWLSLISEHRKRGKVDESRKTYERFFGVFPSAVCVIDVSQVSGTKSFLRQNSGSPTHNWRARPKTVQQSRRYSTKPSKTFPVCSFGLPILTIFDAITISPPTRPALQVKSTMRLMKLS